MKKTVLFLIFFYQKALSPFLNQTFAPTGHACRFTPTCSQYTLEAISHDGLTKGAWRGLRRLFRCHPFSQGGIDFP